MMYKFVKSFLFVAIIFPLKTVGLSESYDLTSVRPARASLMAMASDISEGFAQLGVKCEGVQFQGLLAIGSFYKRVFPLVGFFILHEPPLNEAVYQVKLRKKLASFGINEKQSLLQVREGLLNSALTLWGQQTIRNDPYQLKIKALDLLWAAIEQEKQTCELEDRWKVFLSEQFEAVVRVQRSLQREWIKEQKSKERVLSKSNPVPDGEGICSVM